MQLILYSRDDCPLCDRLEAMIAPHLAALRQHTPVTVTKRDVGGDPSWHLLYHARIPVLALDDRVLLEGRPKDAEVMAAMTRLGTHTGPAG